MREAIIVAFLIVLVMISAVQAIQISGIAKGTAGAPSVTGNAVAQDPMAGHHSGGSQLPQGLQSLPSQVGGC